MLKFTKVQAGHYATEDGTYAVVVDGYTPGVLRAPEERNWAIQDQNDYGRGGEWAAAYDPEGKLRTDHNAGENLDWFPTKREAVAAANDHAARR